MTQYAVIDKATGEEVYRYEADAPIEWNEWEFATHDHVPVVDQAPIVSGTPEPRYGGRRMLTRLEFIDLLGDDVYEAALTMQKTSVQMEGWVKRLEMAAPDADGRSVNLEDPRTVAGIQCLGFLCGPTMQNLVGATWSEEVLRG